jgi:hypothetical protein
LHAAISQFGDDIDERARERRTNHAFLRSDDADVVTFMQRKEK